jgi:hypothetical protein
MQPTSTAKTIDRSNKSCDGAAKFGDHYMINILNTQGL